MLDNERLKFFDLMAATMEIYDHPKLSQSAIGIWWESLQKFDIAMVRQALDEHIRKSKFSPRPADVLEILERIIPDGRPSADEAWAMIPRDEFTSAVMTEEMAKALGIAQPLLDEGDQIAARMAFKDAYNRLVDTAKRLGEPVKWFPSLGSDKNGREAVLSEAVRLGRLSADHAIDLLPPERISSMLENSGKEKLSLEYKNSPSEESKIKIQEMMNILKKKIT